MDKVIVLVVPSESAAYEAVKALKGLDEEGSIELYASTVITKSDSGEISVKDRKDVLEGLGTALGFSMGALIGLLGGPAGAAVGAAVGGAAGLGADLFQYSGLTGDFVNKVAARLKPGSYAVLASVQEDWTEPVDQAVSRLGASVFRQATDDVAAAQIRADMQALKEEQAHAEAEIAHASGEAKKRLEARRDELRKKQDAQRQRLHTRAAKLQESWDARIAAIKEKAGQAKSEARSRHQQHMEKLARFAAAQKGSFHDLFA